MSKTDQAFIDAYRRQPPARTVKASPTPTPTPMPTPVAAGTPSVRPPRERSAAHGPHVRFTGGPKATLSQVMQSRAHSDPHQAAAPTPTLEAPLATTQLNRFALPGVARHLVDNYAEVFAATVEGVSKRWPVLGLVGCRPGSGATTTTLALAWLLAGEGAPVAVIDADPFGSDLAAGLGIARQKTIAETLAAGAALPDAALHAVDDGVSVLVAGELTQHRAVVREAVHQLRQSHAAVLIDLGPDPRRITMHADAVVLVHPQEESDAVVDYSCRSLCQSGAAVVGTIQTMAPAD